MLDLLIFAAATTNFLHVPGTLSALDLTFSSS